MKYKLFVLFFFVVSCAQSYKTNTLNSPYSSKGFAYIYNNKDFENKIIKRKMNNELLQIAHNKLKPGTIIKLINPITKDFITLKNNKRFEFPEFYKIIITLPVAKKLNINQDSPIIEIIEVKKNKSFIAQKAKIYSEEKKIHSNAPVEIVKIDNISAEKNKRKTVFKETFYIIIGEFYSKKSAQMLKKRIIKELIEYDSKKLNIEAKNINKIKLLSGPYTSINLMKNDYILLKKFGFEELDIELNE